MEKMCAEGIPSGEMCAEGIPAGKMWLAHVYFTHEGTKYLWLMQNE